MFCSTDRNREHYPMSWGRGGCRYVPPITLLAYSTTITSTSRLITSFILVWDVKPTEKGAPINWVELKTSAEIRSDRDMDNFEKKLMKFWIQSFLLGVPKIIVGFRSRNGVLIKLEEIETANIPVTAQRRGRAGWDGNTCINFASAFLECRLLFSSSV